MNAPTLTLAVLFVITFMFWVGLETERAQILQLVRNRFLMSRALLANLIFVPLLGFLLDAIFRLPPEISTGFLIVALTPGGLFAMNFARVAKGNIAYDVALVFVLGSISIVIAPFLAYWVSHEVPMYLPAITMGGLILLFILPLFLGALMRKRAERIAHRLSGPMNLISFALFISANVVAGGVRNSALRKMNAEAIAAIVLLVAGAWIIGWLLVGPELQTKKTLAIATSMRNAAIGLLICANLPSDSGILAAITAFSAISVPMNMIFAFILGRMAKRAEKRELKPRLT